MAITMKDIAKDLGVSVVTVSKVLRNHSDISAKTRKRVRQRMKELNYQPNPAARALHTGRTNLIGLTDGQPKTLDEIGKVYGVTRERIRQIESKAMSKLRRPGHGPGDEEHQRDDAHQ